MYELKTCSVCGATGLKRISTEQHDGQAFGVYKCPSCDAELSAYDKYLKDLKKAQAAKADKAAKAASGTTEAGRVGNRPYAKGRAYKEDRY